MKILIIEDEAPIAYYIEDQLRAILDCMPLEIIRTDTLAAALDRLRQHPIDLCLLDLNLRGEDGYTVLQRATSFSFHTIIISAHTELAARAFEYGVIDFVPKPFSRDRLKQALDRYLVCQKNPESARYLAHRLGNRNCLLAVDDIQVLKGCRYLVEARLADGRKVLLEKPLNRLEQILPNHFFRIHRSYLVRFDLIASYEHCGASRYCVHLKDGASLPLSRERVAVLKQMLEAT